MNKRVALVVGGSGGIGGALVNALEARGDFEVAYTYHSKTPPARANVTGYPCDLTKPEELRELAELLVARHGGVDFAVDCATPPLRLKRFDDLAPEEITADVNVILTGGMNLASAILPGMKARKRGVLLYVLSQATKSMPARMSSYVAAKAGLAAFVACAAREYNAASGIRLLGLSPSFVETALLSGFPEKMLELERSRQPGNQLLSADTIAGLIVRMLESEATALPGGTVVEIQNADEILGMAF
jgi:NAD(P)-dependent dehydrogenase (short-subunit alcohol dehydrogenase family)